MKQFKFLSLLLTLVTAICILSCEKNEDLLDGKIETLIIASQRTQVGTYSESPNYWIKREGEEEWELFYYPFSGFDHQEGFEYVVRIKYHKNATPLAQDQEPYYCEVLEVISATEKESDIK